MLGCSPSHTIVFVSLGGPFVGRVAFCFRVCYIFVAGNMHRERVKRIVPDLCFRVYFRRGLSHKIPAFRCPLAGHNGGRQWRHRRYTSG